MSKRPANDEAATANDTTAKRARVSITVLFGDAPGESSTVEVTAIGAASTKVHDTAATDRHALAVDNRGKLGHSMDVVYLVIQSDIRIEANEEEVLGVYSCLKKANREVMVHFMDYGRRNKRYWPQRKRLFLNGTWYCSYKFDDREEQGVRWWVEKRVLRHDPGDDSHGDEVEANFDKAFDGDDWEG